MAISPRKFQNLKWLANFCGVKARDRLIYITAAVHVISGEQPISGKDRPNLAG